MRALKRSPKLVDEEGESWWGSLGGLYRRRGQVEQAIYAYEQAAAVMPNSSYAFSNLAMLYVQQRDRQKMLETFAQVEKLASGEVQADVDNYWAYNDLVTSRLALGQIDEAELALESVFRTVPDDSPYVLESLHDTLIRLMDALDPREARTVREFARRVEMHLAEKHPPTPEPAAGD